MVRVKLDRCSFSSKARFRRPVLSWNQDTQAKFFEILYGVLEKDAGAEAGDFFGHGGTSLGDVTVGANIFGGTNRIFMSADAISASLPIVAADNVELYSNLIRAAYVSFRQGFPEIDIASIATTAACHIRANDDQDLCQTILDGHQSSLFESSDSFQVETLAKMRINENSGAWFVLIDVDRSLQLERGLFLSREINVIQQELIDNPDELFALVDKIDGQVLADLGLDFSEAHHG